MFFKSDPNRKKVVIRTNVLTLMIVAYITIFLMFFVVAFATELTAESAWDILLAPLMALLGGTLAISKDLISDDQEPSTNNNSGKLEHPPTEADNQHTSGEHEV